MSSKSAKEVDRFLCAASNSFNTDLRRVEDFRWLNPGEQAAFVLHLITELRGKVPFGPDPTPVYPPPGIWIAERVHAACGGYSYLLQALVARLGIKSRFVYFASKEKLGHCALELFWRGGLWFIDPLFVFPGIYAGQPRGVPFWCNHLDLLHDWEDNYCAHKVRYDNNSLVAYFYKVRYDDRLIGELFG